MNIMDRNTDMEQMKKILRALLLSVKHGLTPNELCSEYYAMTSQVLPYKAFGYNSAIDLFKDMPEVMQPRHYRDDNNVQRLLLQGVADEHTAHIRALVDRQKTTDTIAKLYSPQNMLSNATKRPVSSFIQSKILVVLQENPAGLDIDSFEVAYATKYGKKLNPLLMGFTSMKSLVESCIDILRYEYVEGDLLMLYAKKGNDDEVTGPREVTSRTNISNELKKNIFAVLMNFNHNGGLFAAQLTTEYSHLHRKPLDFQSLGYTSIVEMMSKLPDTVEIRRPTPDGDFFLVPKMCIMDDDAKIVRDNYQYTTLSLEATSQLIGITLTYVVNPSLFWFQLTEHVDALNILMADMNRFYDSCVGECVMPAECVVVGQPCACRYTDNQWYRGVVRSTSSTDQLVGVFFIDFGDSLDVESSCLCVLKHDYVELPAQAIAGRMNIRHTRRDWTTEQTTRFFEATHDQELFATIMDTRRIVSLELFGPDGNDIGDLCREMIANPVTSADVAAFEISDEDESTDTGTTCSDDVRIEEEVCGEECKDITVSIKCIPVSDEHILHVFPNCTCPCVTSTELSSLFWDRGDIVKHMLRRKGSKIDAEMLMCTNNEALFSTMLQYHVKGITDTNGTMKPSVLVYKLTDLEQIMKLYTPLHEKTVELLESEIRLWTTSREKYWKEQVNNEWEVLKMRRKQLYEKIMKNTADGSTLTEIENLDEQIAGCTIK